MPWAPSDPFGHSPALAQNLPVPGPALAHGKFGATAGPGPNGPKGAHGPLGPLHISAGMVYVAFSILAEIIPSVVRFENLAKLDPGYPS